MAKIVHYKEVCIFRGYFPYIYYYWGTGKEKSLILPRTSSLYRGSTAVSCQKRWSMEGQI